MDLIIAAVGNCTAIFNLSSFEWLTTKLPFNNGIVFSSGESDKVIYMGSNNGNSSLIYEVQTIYGFLVKNTPIHVHRSKR